MVDQSIQTLTINVEKDLLAIIITNLKQNQLDIDQAKELAREFLTLLPIQDKKDLLEKLQKFSEENAETKDMYLKYAKSIEEEERQRKLTQMSEHIKNGQIEHALSIARGETSHV